MIPALDANLHEQTRAHVLVGERECAIITGCKDFTISPESKIHVSGRDDIERVSDDREYRIPPDSFQLTIRPDVDHEHSEYIHMLVDDRRVVMSEQELEELIETRSLYIQE
jgi:hypothetical protein